MHFEMHDETVKFTNAEQAKPYSIYKNTKLKLLKTNAAIKGAWVGVNKT